MPISYIKGNSASNLPNAAYSPNPGSDYSPIPGSDYSPIPGSDSRPDHYGYIKSHSSQQPYTGLLRLFGFRPKPALYPRFRADVGLPQVLGPTRPGRALHQYTTRYVDTVLGLKPRPATG